MNIETIKVGELETNCYILSKDNKCLIIDPGDEYYKIAKALGDKDVIGCLVTHFHIDHIGALEEILYKYDIGVNKENNLFKYEIIETPGHTFDSKTFYFKDENIMFDGDFIFKDGIGRTDLGGSDKDMQNSLKMISEYDENIILYPGHGPSTTLKEEKKHFNMYY